MTDLDLDRIQGFVVRGYRLPLAGYIFLRIDDPARAAAWIAEITNDVLTAAPWSAKPDSGVNIAFSHAGLSALQLPSATLASFPQEFREGMAARASVLGDEGDNAPANWEAPLGSEDVHILVMISAAHQQALSAHDRRIRRSVEQAGGLTTIYDDIGSALPGNREHFAYADGFAQPDIEGAALSQPGGGAPLRDGKWRPRSWSLARWHADRPLPRPPGPGHRE
jgi:deferrochelatase/peroxidase EfeB